MVKRKKGKKLPSLTAPRCTTTSMHYRDTDWLAVGQKLSCMIPNRPDMIFVSTKGPDSTPYGANNWPGFREAHASGFIEHLKQKKGGMKGGLPVSFLLAFSANVEVCAMRYLISMPLLL